MLRLGLFPCGNVGYLFPSVSAECTIIVTDFSTIMNQNMTQRIDTQKHWSHLSQRMFSSDSRCLKNLAVAKLDFFTFPAPLCLHIFLSPTHNGLKRVNGSPLALTYIRVHQCSILSEPLTHKLISSLSLSQSLIRRSGGRSILPLTDITIINYVLEQTQV